MNSAQKIFGISGWKNSGKTTLVSALIAEFSNRGFKVSSIKHAHHNFDIDHEGTDSFKHRASGAQEVLISSANRFALMHEIKQDQPAFGREPSLEELMGKMQPVDLILVEGFKSSHIPKIHACRQDSVSNAGTIEMNNVVAFATDIVGFIDDQNRPIFEINATSDIADFIAQYLNF